MHRSGLASLLALAALCGCADAEPRGQVLLFVNTDVSVPAIADTLRIDLIAADGTATETRTYVLPNASDWPVSFGVAGDAGGPVRLRLRLFGASHVAGRNPSQNPDGLYAPDEPLPAYVIDRLLTVDPPETGVRMVEVLLGTECMGVEPALDAWQTCVVPAGEGATEPRGDPASGTRTLDRALVRGEGSRAGTWVGNTELPCSGTPRPESGLWDEDVCIPGGAFFLGDERLGVNAEYGVAWASIPEHLVLLSPFYVDRYEVSVARARRAFAEGFAIGTGEWLPRSASPWCTYRDDGTTDDLPMTCVSREFAIAFCAWDGDRRVPTEAQWEFAGSGRGRERMYTWGDVPATCEDAIFARIDGLPTGLGEGGQCAHLGLGAQPVASDQQDETDDGVVGLAGNVQEWSLDPFVPLTDPCWSDADGILRDPSCTDPESETDWVIVKGGTWLSVLGSLPVSLRKEGAREFAVDTSNPRFNGPATGFRCVRPAP